MNKKVLVIGGGISGLSAAFYLEKAGADVILVEKEPRLGGLLETRIVDECRIEAGPDSFLAAKPAALELIRDVGLESEVIDSNDHQRRTFIWRKGQLVPMPDGLVMMAPTKLRPLITTSLLSWPAKLKAAREYLRKPSSQSLPERSIGDFVDNHYGREAVEYLAEPLLTGVFGGDVWKLSVNEVLPRFVELESKYGSVTRGLIAERKESSGSLFKTLRGGFSQLIAALDARIQAQRIFGTAQTVSRNGDKWIVRVNDQWIEADHLVIALRAWQAAPLVREFDPKLAGLLDGIAYLSAVTIGLTYPVAGFPHPLNGFGFLVPQVERRNIVACTWVTKKFEHRAPDDKIVLRAFLGGERWCNSSDDEIVHTVLDDLKMMMGINDSPRAISIARWPRSMPQYEIGHRARIDAIRKREHPGLHLIGNAFEGIGIPDCIRLAKRISSYIT